MHRTALKYAIFTDDNNSNFLERVLAPSPVLISFTS